MTLVLIDDDADDRMLFLEAVHVVNDKFHCLTFNNASEALRHLTSGLTHPDHIFLDINMPGMDGRECLREIKKRSNLKEIPVTMYSTSSNPEEIKWFNNSGVGYLNKPTRFETLIESLTSILDPTAVANKSILH